MYFRILQPFEDSFQSLSLVETHVCVAVSIFNTDNHVVNDCHTWTIAQELLVGWFCIILLCFNELMVKVKIILLTGFQLTSSKQGINQQAVHLVCSIEIIGFARSRFIGDVLTSQFFDSTVIWCLRCKCEELDEETNVSSSEL